MLANIIRRSMEHVFIKGSSNISRIDGAINSQHSIPNFQGDANRGQLRTNLRGRMVGMDFFCLNLIYTASIHGKQGVARKKLMYILSALMFDCIIPSS